MNVELYKIFYEIQKKHWWFVTKRKIVLDLIKKYAHLPASPKILDIGCGSGLMLNSLEKIGSTYGMDASIEAVSFSKEIFDGPIELGYLPNDIPFGVVAFDLIVALDVIEHVEEDLASLISIRSRLTPGGVLVLTVPACMSLWSHFDVLNEHKRRYTLDELNNKLHLAGFQVERISYFNSLLFPIVYVVRKFNNFIGRNGSSDVDLPSAPINFVLKKIFGAERFLLKIINFPVGVSILAVLKRKER